MRTVHLVPFFLAVSYFRGPNTNLAPGMDYLPQAGFS